MDFRVLGALEVWSGMEQTSSYRSQPRGTAAERAVSGWSTRGALL
jgi:hypothetical protein